MKENFKITRQMVMEYINIRIKLCTRESGKMINRMDWARKLGLMVLGMKENISLERSMVKENFVLVMELSMMENLLRISSKEMFVFCILKYFIG